MFFRFLLILLWFVFSINSQEIDNFSQDEIIDNLNHIHEKQLITEIHLGNKDLKNPTYIYISPSCLHCAKFIVEDLEKFLAKNQDNNHIVIKFLPVSAKDIFIIKLINNETQNENLFYRIFKDYIKRILAKINQITPTDEQLELFKGSKQDPEMIKFQIGASDFGFSQDKILNAYPKMKNSFEKVLMNEYSKIAKQLSQILDSKEINLPLIVKEDKVYKNLSDIKKIRKVF